jgi:hypothetical protein
LCRQIFDGTVATLGPLGELGEMKITGDCEDLNEIPFAWAAFGGDHGLDADVVLADPPNAATNLTNTDQGEKSLSPLHSFLLPLGIFHEMQRDRATCLSSTGSTPSTNLSTCCHLVKGKIVAVMRGGTPFLEKARIVQSAGAIGLIIINTDDELLSPGGGEEGADITIPVVMLKAKVPRRLPLNHMLRTRHPMD